MDVNTYIGIGITGKQLIDTEDFDCNVADHETRFQFCYLIETFHSLVNPKAILLLLFLCNLIQTMIPVSKISASGGYSTYLCWLRENGSKALTCPTNTDIDTFIDNISTVIHNYVNHDVLF